MEKSKVIEWRYINSVRKGMRLSDREKINSAYNQKHQRILTEYSKHKPPIQQTVSAYCDSWLLSS